MPDLIDVLRSIRTGSRQTIFLLSFFPVTKNDLFRIGISRAGVFDAITHLENIGLITHTTDGVHPVGRGNCLPPRVQSVGLESNPLDSTPPRVQSVGLESNPLDSTPPRVQSVGLKSNPLDSTPLRVQSVGLKSNPLDSSAIDLDLDLDLISSNLSNKDSFKEEEYCKQIELLKRQNAILIQLLQQQGVPAAHAHTSPLGMPVNPPRVIADSPAVGNSDFGMARKPLSVKPQQEGADATPIKMLGTTENVLDQIPRGYESEFEMILQEVIDHLVKTARDFPRRADKFDYKKISPSILHRLVLLRVRHMAGERSCALDETDWRAMLNDDCKATVKEDRIKLVGSALQMTLQDFYRNERWEWTPVKTPSMEWRDEKHHARLHSHQARAQYFPTENTKSKEQQRNAAPLLDRVQTPKQEPKPVSIVIDKPEPPKPAPKPITPPAQSKPLNYASAVAQMQAAESQKAKSISAPHFVPPPKNLTIELTAEEIEQARERVIDKTPQNEENAIKLAELQKRNRIKWEQSNEKLEQMRLSNVAAESVKAVAPAKKASPLKKEKTGLEILTKEIQKTMVRQGGN